MKFIHMADVHLGSKMEARLPSEKAKQRRGELRAAFLKTVEFAARENVKVVLIAGDLFDGNNPLKKDKEFFYDTVKSFPDIDFLYLRGNHDDEGGYEEELPNLKLFSDEWTAYRYGRVVFAGVELTSSNVESLYSSLCLKNEDINIVIMHGEWSDGVTQNKINLVRLKDKYIDYLALGHIHTAAEKKLGERGIAAYSGCLEGRGFDECGEKGFYLCEVDEESGEIDREFISVATRRIDKYEIDISGLVSPSEIYARIRDTVTSDKSDLIRIELIGDKEFDDENLSDDIFSYIGDKYYFVSVKDRSLRKFSIKDYDGDLSLGGEFVREVLSSTLPDELKQKIVSVGMKALGGREID